MVSSEAPNLAMCQHPENVGLIQHWGGGSQAHWHYGPCWWEYMPVRVQLGVLGEAVMRGVAPIYEKKAPHSGYRARWIWEAEGAVTPKIDTC